MFWKSTVYISESKMILLQNVLLWGRRVATEAPVLTGTDILNSIQSGKDLYNAVTVIKFSTTCYD